MEEVVGGYVCIERVPGSYVEVILTLFGEKLFLFLTKKIVINNKPNFCFGQLDHEAAGLV